MKGVLDVYLGRRLAGRLTQDEHGLTTFGYDAGWLAAPDAVPLSHSMPLRSGVFGRNECGAFFAGVLPESGKRSLVARNLGVSANNDYALLERIGGDCAGAITFTESGRSLPPEKGEYRLVRDAELEKLLLGLPRRGSVFPWLASKISWPFASSKGRSTSRWMVRPARTS